jgi:CRP-like cAMP-binding protein
MLFQMNTRPHIADTINNSVLFNGLAGDQIAELIKIGSHKHLPPQSILFHQADPAVTCFMVIQGRLKLTKLNDQGQEVIIRYIQDSLPLGRFGGTSSPAFFYPKFLLISS